MSVLIKEEQLSRFEGSQRSDLLIVGEKMLQWVMIWMLLQVPE